MKTRREGERVELELTLPFPFFISFSLYLSSFRSLLLARMALLISPARHEEAIPRKPVDDEQQTRRTCRFHHRIRTRRRRRQEEGNHEHACCSSSTTVVVVTCCRIVSGWGRERREGGKHGRFSICLPPSLPPFVVANLPHLPLSISPPPHLSIHCTTLHFAARCILFSFLTLMDLDLVLSRVVDSSALSPSLLSFTPSPPAPQRRDTPRRD